jgi:hypothetical protein
MAIDSLGPNLAGAVLSENKVCCFPLAVSFVLSLLAALGFCLVVAGVGPVDSISSTLSKKEVDLIASSGLATAGFANGFPPAFFANGFLGASTH